VVSYPKISWDETYARGADRMTLPVGIMVGLSSDAKSVAAALSAYLAATGTRSIKAVLESGTYTAFDVLTVMSAEVDVVDVGAVSYVRANFELDIYGTGA